MSKLTITLTLTEDEATHLVSTLRRGAEAWFGHDLQRDAHKLARYAERRVDDAVLARGRARRRRDAQEGGN